MLQELEIKLEELNNIPNINRGGCAIVAMSIALFITRRILSAKPEVHYTCWSSNKDAIKRKDISALDCSHAFVKWNNLFIDSDGIISDENEISHRWLSADKIPLKLVENHIISTNHWNSMFDRHNTKKIDTILGSCFHKKLKI